MIITLKNTTSAEVASRIVELRDERGAAALSRVLTLLICVPDLIDGDNAIEVSDAVSREHPCRVIVIVEPESTEGTARLNAQIRVGDAAGLSDIIILEPRGEAASNIDSLDGHAQLVMQPCGHEERRGMRRITRDADRRR